MPLEISDDQLREVEVIAGVKWNRIREVLGLSQTSAPDEPEVPEVSGTSDALTGPVAQLDRAPAF